jgi:hypothetical protein
MRRSLRYLRIAFSATCLIACVLLIALWVRSLTWTDCLACRTYISYGFIVDSAEGHIGLYYPSVGDAWQRSASQTAEDFVWAFTKQIESNWLFSIAIPHGVCIAAFAAIAALPWIRLFSRFSLRTLLIATTLVAVVLGLIVAVLRWPAG